MSGCLNVEKSFFKTNEFDQTAFESVFKQMIMNKIIFNRFDSANKKCKLVDYKKNI